MVRLAAMVLKFIMLRLNSYKKIDITKNLLNKYVNNVTWQLKSYYLKKFFYSIFNNTSIY